MSKQTQKNQNQMTARNKRVKRMKNFIVFCAVFLLLASVILNLALVFKVMHLQNQIDKLYSSVQMEHCLES